MTTATVDAAPAMARTRAASPYRRTFVRALRSEWIKLATLRSTWWSIGFVALITVGTAMLIAQTMGGDQFPPVQAIVAPIQFTMLFAGVMGAIAVTGEYSTGMIRSTLTADPVRGSVLAAKAIVVALFLFVASFVVFMTAAIAVTPIFAAYGVSVPWSEPADLLMPVLAASFSMAVFALIGVSFGFVLRSGAGAIAATVGVLFVLPMVMGIFSMVGEGWEWVLTIANHLPMTVAQSAILPQEGYGVGVAEAYLTLGAWIVAGVLSAWAVLRTRDA